jgi:hypothetical protein
MIQPMKLLSTQKKSNPSLFMEIQRHISYFVTKGKIRGLEQRNAKLLSAAALVEDRCRQEIAAILLWEEQKKIKPAGPNGTLSEEQSSLNKAFNLGVAALVSGASKFDRQIIGMNVGLNSRPFRFSDRNEQK